MHTRTLHSCDHSSALFAWQDRNKCTNSDICSDTDAVPACERLQFGCSSVLPRFLAKQRMRSLVYIFWDITPCSPLRVNRRFGGSPYYLFHVDFLVGLFFDPKDRGNMFLRNVVDFQQATRRYIPENRTLHKIRSLD
jgi:hypothetical protein